MNAEDYFNKRPESYPKAGYDPRINKYYELLEETEALKKKISFLQAEINKLNNILEGYRSGYEPFDPFSMKEQGW